MPEQHILDRLTTLEAKIDKLNSTVSSIETPNTLTAAGIIFK